MTLEQAIRQGESQILEFKESLSLSRQALEPLCGMVNSDTGRGTVIFGVSSTGVIKGVEPGNLDKAQRSLAQTIGQKFEPRLMFQILLAEVRGKQILVLAAERPRSVAYHEFDGRAFVREGTTTRQLSLTEKRALLKKRDRDQHNGPWRCDRCGSITIMLVSVEVMDAGIRKTYDCTCGGEYWPAT